MPIQYIEARYTTLAWRNHWLAEIDKGIEDELQGLYIDLNNKIEGFSIKDIVFTDSFIEKTIDPVILSWKLEQLNLIVSEAEKDLAKSSGKSIVASLVNNELGSQPLMSKVLDLAGATATTGLAIAAVPVTASLSVVSAGGVAGLLGATTIAAPVVLAGAVVVTAAGFLARSKIANLKSGHQERLKESINLRVYEDIIFNKAGTSLRQLLKGAVEQTAEVVLKDFKDKVAK